MIGRELGSYTILKRIGEGGMGEVYLAQHRRIEKLAAIKLLLPALSRDPDVVARFFNEARATSRIKHPGIIEVYDCDVLDERAYIVMEYLQGESLASAIARSGGFGSEPRSVASVVGQIASALAAAHDKGIVHRDLKPDNVFLAIDETGAAPFVVKILDFGIAKLLDENSASSHTRTGSVLGTPLYMSPEQCRGLRNIDHRADIYALGCITFEMATGHPPFEREAPGDLLVAHIAEIPPAASSITPGLPPALDLLISQMLAKDPEARPGSMKEVLTRLEEILETKAAQFSTMILPASTMIPVRAHSDPHLAGLPTPGSAGIPTPGFAGTPRPGFAGTPRPGFPGTPRPGFAGTPTPGQSRSTPHARTPRSSSDPGSRSGAGGTRLLPDNSTFRHSASEMIRGPEPPSRRGGWIAGGVVLGAALAGGIVFLVLRPPAGQPPTKTESPALHAPEETPPPPRREPPPPPLEERRPEPPATVSLEIASHPSGAEVFVGGETTSRGKTPFVLITPRDTQPLEIVLQASGYREKRLSLDRSQAGAVTVPLERQSRGRRGGQPSQTPPQGGNDKAPPKQEDNFYGVGD